MNAQEIKAEAERLSAETQDSPGGSWRMDPIAAYYYDAGMNGDSSDDSTYHGDGTIANEMFVPSPEEREAFGLSESDVVVLTYYSAGGAPYAEVCTLVEWEEHRNAWMSEHPEQYE